MARNKRMTVCDDWPTGTAAKMCWFFNGHETGAYCDLGVFERSNFLKVCPHAKALRAVSKNSKLVLEAREKEDLKMEICGPQQGWQCPVCGRVYAPFTVMCLNSNCGQTHWATSTGVDVGVGDYQPDKECEEKEK